MTEGNRKQKRSRARQASVGDQRLFLKIPAGRFLRNHSRFHGAVSADRAGLFRTDGPAFAPGRRQDARLRTLQPKSGNKFRPLGKTPVPFTNAYD